MAEGTKKGMRGSRSTSIKRNASLANMTTEEYKKRRDKERLHAWTKKKRQDPAYRAKVAERQKAKRDQLVADAELGRMARAFLASLGTMLGELANLKNRAMDGAAHNGEVEIGNHGLNAVAQHEQRQ